MTSSFFFYNEIFFSLSSFYILFKRCWIKTNLLFSKNKLIKKKINSFFLKKIHFLFKNYKILIFYHSNWKNFISKNFYLCSQLNYFYFNQINNFLNLNSFIFNFNYLFFFQNINKNLISVNKFFYQKKVYNFFFNFNVKFL